MRSLCHANKLLVHDHGRKHGQSENSMCGGNGIIRSKQEFSTRKGRKKRSITVPSVRRSFAVDVANNVLPV